MPYKSEKIKLKGLQDRRRRLTDEQRKQIKELYKTGIPSLNDLAKRFSVSKKTILLIVIEYLRIALYTFELLLFLASFK